MNLDLTDTIAAISSPPGPGLRGLVRLSGPAAWAIARAGFTPDADVPADPPSKPAWRPGRLAVDGLGLPLPASLALWPAPRTYTGQNLAEIHTVGSPPLLDLVLAHCLARGARLAEPGEFTLRAFLAGRIDLTQAEAVLGVIDARSASQLEGALKQLAGGLATPIGRLRDWLLDVLAHLEAGLDFVDEPDVDPIGRQALAAELADAARSVADLADRLRGRDRPEGLPRVVLIGPPNAGKSRLFNALLGHDRAIVSPQAGTTRDYLSAACSCDRLDVELIDTAGLESTADPIAVSAQSHRADQAARADLLLICEPSDAPHTIDNEDPTDIPAILVLTKADMAAPGFDAARPGSSVLTSALTGEGLGLLRQAIASALRSRAAEGDLPASTGARCRDSLARAREALDSAAATLAAGGGDELVAIDLHQALDELGKVVGAVVTDDILDRIFRRFCIGK